MPANVNLFKTSSPKKRRRPTPAAVPATDQRTALACRLDRGADVLLSWGNHLAAERLSLRAQALRETRL